MIVAITGGTGFVGAKLVQFHASRGDQVRVLTRKVAVEHAIGSLAQLFQGDLSSEQADLAGFVDGADVLYHCAGETADAMQMTAVHVQGTQRLIDAARQRIGRWVQLSSVGAYGARCEGVITEDTAPEPCGIYEQTKLRSDDLVLEASVRGDFGATIVRPSIVFGPEMRNQSLFHWISMIQRGWFFYVGAPGASANYIFVDNVVEALHRCASQERAADNIYNVSDWRSVESFVATIARLVGRPAPRLRIPARPVEVIARCLETLPMSPITGSRVKALSTRARYPCDKIARELGYSHVVPMEAGLARTVARWRGSHLHHAASIAAL